MSKQSSKPVTLLDFFERVYLPERLKNKRPSYRQAYSRTVQRFTAFCRGDIEIVKVTPETFKAYKDWHMECHRGAPATVYGDVVRIRRILAAAGRCELRGQKARRQPNVTPRDDLPLEVDAFYSKVYKREKCVSDGYDMQIRIALRSLRRFHKRPVLFDELPDVMNRWIAWLQLNNSPRTVKGKRATVLTLWLAAADYGICDSPDTRHIRRVKIQRAVPDAWTLAELKSLIEATAMIERSFYPNGVERRLFWEAFIRVCYDTALRRGDMLALKRSQIEKIEGGHVLRSVQSKTGDGIVHRLRPATVAAVDALFPPTRELIFDWPHGMNAFHHHWQEVLDCAGMDLDRRNGVQKIRRTSASHLEAISPGAATKHLGHRTGDMARMHYLDEKISRGELPMPPDLDVA
jgi:integrase